jgi:hypothetical protein
VLLLDLDGNGSVSAAEGAQRITRTWVVDRLLGRAAVPGLLPSSASAQDLTRAGNAAMELMNVVLMAANDVLTHPERYGTFTLEPAGGGSAFTGLIGTGGAALAALAEIIRSATAQGLSAFGDLFDPSLTITGALQPTFLGLPLGDPTVGGTMQLDRTGLYLEFEGSLTELSKAAASSSFPGGAPALNGILSSATLGVSDRMSIGARLPVGGLIDTLIAGGTLPTFQPLDPNWAVTMSGSMTVFGFDTANVSGIAFLPGQRNLLNSKVQKLYELPEGTPIDPRLFPVSTRERFESLVTYGGLLVTASLNLPRLVTDPAAQLAAVPPPPDDITQYPAWLEQVARLAGQVDSAARMQMFVPGLIGVSDTSATAWASSMYVEGVYNGRLLGFQLGRATMQVSPAGLEVEGAIPLIGGRTTMVLNTGLLSGGTRLPSVGVDTSLDSQAFRDTLVRAGMPAAFVPSAGGSGRFRMYTPGANPSSTDPLLRNGGMQLSGRLDLPGLVTGAVFDTELVARGSGFDLHARAEVDRIGPLAGVTIEDAFIDLDVVDGIGAHRRLHSGARRDSERVGHVGERPHRNPHAHRLLRNNGLRRHSRGRPGPTHVRPQRRHSACITHRPRHCHVAVVVGDSRGTLDTQRGRMRRLDRVDGSSTRHARPRVRPGPAGHGREGADDSAAPAEPRCVHPAGRCSGAVGHRPAVPAPVGRRCAERRALRVAHLRG